MLFKKGAKHLGNGLQSICIQHGPHYMNVFCFFLFLVLEKPADKQRSRAQNTSRAKRSGRKGGQSKGKRNSSNATQQHSSKADVDDENSQDMSDSAVK